MNIKKEVLYLNSRIMIEIEQLNLLLSYISEFKTENRNEAAIFADIALSKGKSIDRKNQKIEQLINHEDKIQF